MNKKSIGIKLLFLCVTFLLGVYSVVGYEEVYSKEQLFISTSTINNNSKYVAEEIALNNTRKENKTTVSIPVIETANKTVTNNYIKVAGVKRNLMKDNGTHYYLNRNIDGVYDGRGVPYVDYRYDFTGRKTIIYAHSIKGGDGPFQPLQNYHNNYSFYNNNRYITIHYGNNDYTYEIFSVYVSTADNEKSEGLEYYYRNNYTEEEWKNTLEKYKDNSEYNTNVNVSSNDKILILQTCSMDPNYFKKYYRYNLLVIGKLI